MGKSVQKRGIVKRGKPRGPQYTTARHREQRETRDGRRAMERHPYPNQQEFGERGEWVDAQGHHYRVATAKHPSEWAPGLLIPWPTHEQRQRLLEQRPVVLWVKLHKQASAAEWFDLRGGNQAHENMELRPLADGLPPLRLGGLGYADRRRPQGRTGLIRVQRV